MSALGALFVAVCMVAMAAALTVTAVLGFGVQPATGMLAGSAAAGLLGAGHHALARSRERRDAADRLEALGRTLATLAQRFDALDRRLGRMDEAAKEAVKRAVMPVSGEVAELGAIVRQLTEQIQRQERALADLQARPATLPGFEDLGLRPTLSPAEADPAHPEIADAEARGRAETPALQRRSQSAPAVELYGAVPLMSPPMAAREPEDVRRVRRALERGAIELRLQPIVMLPQRRVTHYEALAHLRDEEDRLLLPEEFLRPARSARLLPSLDAAVLDRALRIVRRLKARERDVGLLVAIAGETLASGSFPEEIARRLDAHADAAGALTLAFSQEALRGFGALEREMLASIAEKGFRFAVDAAEDLSLDPRALHALGVRHLKLPGALLLGHNAPASARHPADLPGLMKRHGIVLIAAGIETETDVAHLLDLDVGSAQGHLFGAPRAVRPEIFAAGEAARPAQQDPSASRSAGARSAARPA